MSFKVNFFTFGKKLNSTSVPAVTGAEFDCVLKDASNMMTPEIKLMTVITSRPTYNLCKITAWNRWYWIREWRFENRLWIATLEVDVLGTYKSDIGAAQFYVLRCASAKSEYVIDNKYPITSQGSPITTQGSTSSWWTVTTNLASGTFVVGLRGLVDTSQPSGGITYVAFTPAQFRTWLNKVFQNDMQYFIQGGSLDISDTLARMVFDPEQYVTSCIWHPGSITSTSTSNGIYMGYWQFTGTYSIVNPTSFASFTQRIQLPTHPYSATRGKYLNGAPYSTHAVFLPRYGLMDLSSSIPANAVDIVVELHVDPISGQGLYYVYYTTVHNSSTTYLIDIIQVQIGVEIPLSSTARTLGDTITNLSTAGSFAKDIVTGNILGAAGDILSGLNVYQPHINDIGKASGYLGISTADPSVPYVVTQRMYPCNEDPTENGYPYCKVETISNLSGFIQVLHGDIAIQGATIGELETLKNHLETGFFYE